MSEFIVWGQSEIPIRPKLVDLKFQVFNYMYFFLGSSFLVSSCCLGHHPCRIHKKLTVKCHHWHPMVERYDDGAVFASTTSLPHAEP